MTITSIGSSFSYIRPEAAARETAAVTAQAEASAVSPPGFGAPAAQATGSAKPGVADQLRALLVRAQESGEGPSASEAARAYGGR